METSIKYARYIESTDSFQLLEDHLLGVAELAECFADKCGYGKFGFVLGLLHDLGKYSSSWQSYLVESIKRKGLIEKADHATVGAQYLNRLISDENQTQNGEDNLLLQAAVELLEMVIMYHHGQGLPDMISPDGCSPFLTRLCKSSDETFIEEITQVIPYRFTEIISNSLSVGILLTEFSKLFQAITAHLENSFRRNEQWMFEGGLFCRFLSSCLIDADRLNSAAAGRNTGDEKKTDWKRLLEKLENHLSCFESETQLDKIRQEISEKCRKFAEKPKDVFTLSAATGSGKTLASLRYALKYAELNNSEKILIIAPYTSILEQNAGIIKKILEENGGSKLVLECHSNIVMEDEEDKSQYSLHSERWNAPIICTTMVQFLESIFASGTKKIRRMHQVSNAVIIFDEIQTLPLKCTCLFNWLIPFLKHICNSSILLCTATQPALDLFEGELAPFRLNLSKDNEIIPKVEKHFNDLKRVDVVDRTTTKGSSFDEIISFIVAQINKDIDSILVVVNTKPQAAQLFTSLQSCFDEESLYHLSTNMCPAHRKRSIEEIRRRLQQGRKVICISTRLIEAGVDLDFSCAIRFLAGLDSIAQTAGRCNRNGLLKNNDGMLINGKTYIVNIEGESLGSLDELKRAQNITRRVLSEFHSDEKKYDFSILHPSLISQYFKYVYSSEDIAKLTYSFSDSKFGKVNIMDILSKNIEGLGNFRMQHKEIKPPFFTQAFQTGWKNFEVIEQNTIGVIVPYKKGTEIIGRLASLEYEDFNSINELLHEAQLYSVALYQNQLLNFKEQITIIKLVNDCTVYYVNEGYYSPEKGLSKDFSGCSVMNY